MGIIRLVSHEPQPAFLCEILLRVLVFLKKGPECEYWNQSRYNRIRLQGSLHQERDIILPLQCDCSQRQRDAE